ncbi:DUF4350 domain-containing protein [Amycolatopsis sp.]|uniref:DUF4350 domain-containing protein n=1 Tax=Amycolatopsis sp. TaxID=37632 RepID=UPI002C7F31C6|nr:DUF4350 domain-containing protein [Amycolatopsis sp.]HVV10757.1 DUF4350 domain-containing protein [Amycolatopsis sp.]
MTTVSPDGKRIWQAARAPLFIAVVVLLGAVGLLLVQGGDTRGALDPGAAEPAGSLALARLLEQQGVRIVTARTFDEASKALQDNATLLVTEPDLVQPAKLGELRGRAADAVFIAPGEDTLDILLPGVGVAGESDVGVRTPGCTVAAAVAAGNAVLGGTEYAAHERVRSCYDGSLLQMSGSTTLLGTGAPLTNDRLDDEGDAALALRLLGRQATLVWYLPTAGDAGAGEHQRSLTELLPRGWFFGAVQLGVAAVLFVLWRARRLGPVVPEPLPVVVRAAETVEGRARLYRRSGSAAHAAEILRQATLSRLVPVLGLGADAEPAAVVSAVMARCGRDAGVLLYGPPPGDDASLVAFADELDRLEREVRGF